jgi:HlyD family type I secretion membrane fusion protein
MHLVPKTAPWQGLHTAANVRTYILSGLIVILVFFAGFGGWAALAPLSGAVIAIGVVKVDTNRKTVQHLEGGIVKEILVRDGDHVGAGQALIVLQDERVGATLDLLQGQLDAEFARMARLQAERDGKDHIEFPDYLVRRADQPEVADLLRNEDVFFNTKRAALEEQINLIRRQISEAQEQINGLTSQVRAEEAAVGYLQEEITANEELEKKQYVQKVHILELKRGVEEYQARRGEHLADIAIARQKITELQVRIIDLKNAYVREAADKLTLSQAAIYDIEERLRPARDATVRQQITAPISGTVVNQKVFTVSGVIGPREPILDIVPDDNPLIIEAQVRVDDIDDLRLGQEADIRLSAYKMRSTPLVLGYVTYISADRLINQATQEPYYLAHIEVDMESLRSARNLQLYPGMPAEVFVKTGARTAIDYLLAPITQTLRRSMRES